jgi:hypothetical protein
MNNKTQKRTKSIANLLRNDISNAEKRVIRLMARPDYDTALDNIQDQLSAFRDEIDNDESHNKKLFDKFRNFIQKNKQYFNVLNIKYTQLLPHGLSDGQNKTKKMVKTPPEKGEETQKKTDGKPLTGIPRMERSRNQNSKLPPVKQLRSVPITPLQSDNSNKHIVNEDPKNNQKQNNAATKIQAQVRSELARKQLQKRNNAATKLQAQARSEFARKQLQKQNKAATKLQAQARSKLAKKQMNTLKTQQNLDHIQQQHNNNIARLREEAFEQARHQAEQEARQKTQQEEEQASQQTAQEVEQNTQQPNGLESDNTNSNASNNSFFSFNNNDRNSNFNAFDIFDTFDFNVDLRKNKEKNSFISYLNDLASRMKEDGIEKYDNHIENLVNNFDKYKHYSIVVEIIRTKLPNDIQTPFNAPHLFDLQTKIQGVQRDKENHNLNEEINVKIKGISTQLDTIFKNIRENNEYENTSSSQLEGLTFDTEMLMESVEKINEWFDKNIQDENVKQTSANRLNEILKNSSYNIAQALFQKGVVIPHPVSQFLQEHVDNYQELSNNTNSQNTFDDPQRNSMPLLSQPTHENDVNNQIFGMSNHVWNNMQRETNLSPNIQQHTSIFKTSDYVWKNIEPLKSNDRDDPFMMSDFVWESILPTKGKDKEFNMSDFVWESIKPLKSNVNDDPFMMSKFVWESMKPTTTKNREFMMSDFVWKSIAPTTAKDREFMMSDFVWKSIAPTTTKNREFTMSDFVWKSIAPTKTKDRDFMMSDFVWHNVNVDKSYDQLYDKLQNKLIKFLKQKDSHSLEKSIIRTTQLFFESKYGKTLKKDDIEKIFETFMESYSNPLL